MHVHVEALTELDEKLYRFLKLRTYVLHSRIIEGT